MFVFPAFIPCLIPKSFTPLFYLLVLLLGVPWFYSPELQRCVITSSARNRTRVADEEKEDDGGEEVEQEDDEGDR